MVGEAWLPSNAYFRLTPDYIPFTLSPCLSVWTLLIFAFVYNDFMIFFLNTILACWPQIHLKKISASVVMKRQGEDIGATLVKMLK